MTHPPGPSSPAPRGSFPGLHRWLAALGALLVLGAIATALRIDLVRAAGVAAISAQGSPRPPADAASPTGYASGERYFLGAQERGETFRWIAAAQEMIATGAPEKAVYTGDNPPDGRPALEPRLYTGWIAAVAWLIHLGTGQPAGMAVEGAARWEPVLAHLAMMTGVLVFMGRRFGLKAAAAAGFFVALFPALGGQFLPGVLSPRPWAMMLGAWALGLACAWGGESRPARGWFAPALAAGLALWLEPAIGFPVVLVTAGAGLVLAALRGPPVAWLRWSLSGAGVVLAGWFVDRAPAAFGAGELRSVHPFYAFAWFGLGLFLHGLQARSGGALPGRARLALAAGAIAVIAATTLQVRSGFAGWLHPAVALRQLTSLDEATAPFSTLAGWIRDAATGSAAFMLLPATGAFVLVGTMAWRQRRSTMRAALFAWLAAALGLGLLGFFRVRWWPVVSLAALPLYGELLPRLPAAGRRCALGMIACYLGVLFPWRVASAPPAGEAGAALAAADVEALVFRHFAFWFATHTPGDRATAVLASPTLSDSLVYHANSRALMSTAWESYPGQVAASRILSAPDWNEAEGLLRRRGITHVVINSWDPLLAGFVRAPAEHRKGTFYEKLQRWVFPGYLRPVPYHVPAGAGFDGQAILVLRVTEPQDEALALSRLAEYFVEMDRDYLATAAARILGESFGDDPNAMIARATVFHRAQDRAAFSRELLRLVQRHADDAGHLAWDRRVQRAVVFALGGRHDLARAEIAACTDTLSAENLQELTALQVFHYLKLADAYGVALPQPGLRRRAEALCAEYSPTGGRPVSPRK